MKSTKWKFFLVVLLIAAVIAGIMKSKSHKTPGESFAEISPAYGNIEIFISTTGTVEPQNRLEIKPPISGRVEEILVQEGDKVKIGRVLALMSSTERAALLDAARAEGEEALKYWQDVYKVTPLIAPIDGEVIVRAVEPGQTVTANDVMLVLSDRLIVKARVDEIDIGKVNVGQEAIVSLDAYPRVKVKSTVDHISYESELINNVTIYEVDILPEEIPDFFRSGMSANVDITEEKKENVLLIPIEAVYQDKEGTYVLLSEAIGQKNVKRMVQLGASDDKNVEILSGLTPRDKIIVRKGQFVIPKSQNSSSPFMPFGRR
ncbi:MAG: efflux RND transporter periplasmic adaptor subunit [Candidatus Omnitrophota bacterium]